MASSLEKVWQMNSIFQISIYKNGRMNSNLTQRINNPSLLTPQNQNQPVVFHLPQGPNPPARCFQPLVRIDRSMYSSNIQLPSFPTDKPEVRGGLGGLQRMGRMVSEEGDTDQCPAKEKIVRSATQQPKPLTFRTDRNPKSKMAASSIFTQNLPQNMNNSPWQASRRTMPNAGIDKLQGEFGKQGQGESVCKGDKQAGEERRKPQIVALKKEFELFNSKLEHTLASNSKKEQKQRTYFQLPRRNPTQPFNPLPTQQPSTISQQNESNSEAEWRQVNGQLQTVNKAKAQEMITPYVGLKESPKVEIDSLFKKKKIYLNQDISNNNHQQTIQILNNASSPQVPTTINNISKPIEPSKPLLSIKPDTPRQFKKSDFAIGRRMGKGQFGQVMMVIHKETGFLCGMKIMSKKQIRQQKYANQISRELSIQFFLTHRHIAPLYGFFQDQDSVYLLVEFCTDGQLFQRLRKSHRLQEKQTSCILREVCEGLDYIHRQQIIHRDVKPQNILFQMGTVKISDFGWAVFAQNSLRRTVSGTPLYYSPELVTQSQYDQKIDVWSVGLMAYECLIGRIPFKIYSQFDLNRILSDEVTFPEYVDLTDYAKDFILRALRKKADQRMEISEMLAHPFIAKYRPKGGNEGVQQLRRLLSN